MLLDQEQFYQDLEFSVPPLLQESTQYSPRDIFSLSCPTTILLTGATGFIGRYILADILKHSFSHVVCIVRCKTDSEVSNNLYYGVKYEIVLKLA